MLENLNRGREKSFYTYKISDCVSNRASDEKKDGGGVIKILLVHPGGDITYIEDPKMWWFVKAFFINRLCSPLGLRFIGFIERERWNKFFLI